MDLIKWPLTSIKNRILYCVPANYGAWARRTFSIAWACARLPGSVKLSGLHPNTVSRRAPSQASCVQVRIKQAQKAWTQTQFETMLQWFLPHNPYVLVLLTCLCCTAMAQWAHILFCVLSTPSAWRIPAHSLGTGSSRFYFGAINKVAMMAFPQKKM